MSRYRELPESFELSGSLGAKTNDHLAIKINLDGFRLLTQPRH